MRDFTLNNGLGNEINYFVTTQNPNMTQSVYFIIGNDVQIFLCEP